MPKPFTVPMLCGTLRVNCARRLYNWRPTGPLKWLPVPGEDVPATHPAARRAQQRKDHSEGEGDGAFMGGSLESTPGMPPVAIHE